MFLQEAALAAVRELREGGAAWVYLECCSAEYSSSACSLDSHSPSSHHSSEPARPRAGTERPLLTPQPSPCLTWSRVRRNTTGVGRRGVQPNNVGNVYTVNFMDLHGLQRQDSAADKDMLEKDRLEKDRMDKDRLDRLDKERLTTDCCVTSPLVRRAGRMAVERKRRVDTTVRWTSWRDPGTAESAV